MTEIKNLHAVADICSQLISDIQADFIGLALQNEVGPDVMWHYADGNLNDKYKRITVRFGKGIAGRVISTGSEMLIEEFPNGIIGKATDYPIILAEKLISSYAVPLFFGGVSKGVLLAGTRVKHLFNDKDKDLVNECAKSLEQILRQGEV